MPKIPTGIDPGGVMHPSDVVRAARSIPEDSPYRFGDKVLIVRVASVLGRSVSDLRPWLLQWQREGELELARVDMVAGMGVVKAIERSMIRAPGMPETSGWHAVLAPPATARFSPNASGAYYVWVLRQGSDVPLSSEGPYGPMSLLRAEQTARVGATKGIHDRAVSRGRDPSSGAFRILRRYAAGNRT
jgi:hypothetical protein